MTWHKRFLESAHSPFLRRGRGPHGPRYGQRALELPHLAREEGGESRIKGLSRDLAFSVNVDGQAGQTLHCGIDRPDEPFQADIARRGWREKKGN